MDEFVGVGVNRPVTTEGLVQFDASKCAASVPLLAV